MFVTSKIFCTYHVDVGSGKQVAAGQTDYIDELREHYLEIELTQTLFLSKLQHSLYILHFYIIHKGRLLGTAYQQDIRCVLTKILMIFQAFKKMMSV